MARAEARGASHAGRARPQAGVIARSSRGNALVWRDPRASALDVRLMSGGMSALAAAPATPRPRRPHGARSLRVSTDPLLELGTRSLRVPTDPTRGLGRLTP